MNNDIEPGVPARRVSRVLVNVSQSILSGVILAILFFVSREVWFPLPSVAGRWLVETHTTKTNYRPYQGMVVEYVAIVWREGANIKGTIEKISEVTATDTTTYVGDQRIRGDIEGHVHKLYLSKDRIALHIIEEGTRRQSTDFHDLTVEGDDRLVGTFISTAADSEGTVTWRRVQPQ